MEYKAGDKIKCVNNLNNSNIPNEDLTLGKTYTITRVELFNGISWQYWFIMDDGEERFFNDMYYKYFINITKQRKDKLIKIKQL